MKRLAIVLGLACGALSLLSVGSAANRPLTGDLDHSFGRAGIVTYGLGDEQHPSIRSIAPQTDGKIVVLGLTYPSVGADGYAGTLVARYERDGSLDQAFGSGGVVKSQALPGSAVTLQPGHGILVAGGEQALRYGGCGQALTVARLNSNGSLDTTFGQDGITTTPTGDVCVGVSSVVSLSDSKILVGGWAEPTESSSKTFLLARYEPDGALDTSFGVNGLVRTSFRGRDEDALTGLAVEPSGKIIAVGWAEPSGSTDGAIALARYTANGAPDASFGVGGKVTTSVPNVDYGGTGIALQSRGKIVVSGYRGTCSPFCRVASVVARYTGAGRLDSTFGRRGVATVGGAAQGGFSAVVAQAHRKVLVAGDAVGDHLVLARLKSDGKPDPHFGRKGLVITSVKRSQGRIGDSLADLALQSDGRILAGGSVDCGCMSGSGLWLLVRYHAGNNCVVPDVLRKGLRGARRAVSRAYCKVGSVKSRRSRSVARGHVVSQSPKRGARLPGGSKVKLVVSKGKRR